MKESRITALLPVLLSLVNKAVYGNSNKNDIQKACKAFSVVLSKLIGQAVNPAAGAAVKAFTEVIIQVTGDKKKDMWTAIEERLETRIDSKITHNHFGTLVSKIKQLQAYMKPEWTLTKMDLEVHILPMKDQFLPQTFAYTSYNSKWATALPAYLSYMTAAYLQLVYDGKVDRCSLAKELQTIRNETVQAAKALFRARYRSLNGVKSYRAWPDHECTGGMCPHAQWLSFEDGVSGKVYSKPLVSVWKIFSDIYYDTAKFVWSQLVDKVNAFFTDDVCVCADECPKPILQSEVKFRYPTSCYGDTNSGVGCTLPCHSYDDGYLWCPNFRSNFIPRSSLLFNNWDYCKKDKYFLKCMPVKGTTIFEDSSD